MRIFIAWVKKKLCIQSPTTITLGYKYEYDYLRAKGRKLEKESEE